MVFFFIQEIQFVIFGWALDDKLFKRNIYLLLFRYRRSSHLMRASTNPETLIKVKTGKIVSGPSNILMEEEIEHDISNEHKSGNRLMNDGCRHICLVSGFVSCFGNCIKNSSSNYSIF